MALHYDITKVDDAENVNHDELFEVCCFLMLVQVGSIRSDKEQAEAAFRIGYYLRCVDGQEDGIEKGVRLAKRYRGIAVNVATKPRAAFMRHMNQLATARVELESRQLTEAALA